MYSANSQFGPSHEIITRTIEESRYSTKADMDLDGDVDVLARYNGYLILHILEAGQYSQQLITSQELAATINWATPLTGDMDGDSDQDIILENRWLENIGMTFTNVHFYIDENSEDFMPLVGDLNNDGYNDLLLYNPFVFEPGPAGFLSLLNDGTGNFTSNAIPGGGVQGFRMELSDINCDGFLDMVYMRNNQSYSLACGFNDGTGSFSSPVDITDFYYYVSWALADFNGDTFVDIAIEGVGDFQLKIYYNTGSGIPASPEVYDVPIVLNVHQSDLEDRVVDYDGDSDLDLILDETGAVYWMENTDTGFVWAGFIMDRPVNQPDVWWIEINGDGRPDAVGTYMQLITFLQDTNGEQLPNNIECESCAFGSTIYTTDLDNDLQTDVVGMSTYGIHHLDLNSYGGLEGNMFMDVIKTSYLQKGKFFDFDFDGDMDFLQTSYGFSGPNSSILGYMNMGENNFNLSLDLLTFPDTYIRDITPMDYDSDGVQDLLILLWNDDNLNLHKYKYSNTMGWEFQGVIFTCTCDNCNSQQRDGNSLLMGDFNGDSFMDISFIQPGNGYILEGDGTGNYTAIEVVVDSSLDVDMQLAVKDFNNDGREDILYQSMIYGNIANAYATEKLRLIKYNGTVYTISNLVTATNIIDAVTADFDLDGDMDIVYGVFGTPTKMFLINNNGNGTFDSSIQLNLEIQGYYLRDIETLDLDGDNMYDLLYTVGDGELAEAYLNSSINISDSPYKIEYHVFIDANANGVQDIGENGYANAQISLSNDLGYLFANELGEYVYFGLPGEITSSINPNSDLWNATTSWTQSVILDELNPTAQVFFALSPNGSQPLVEGVLTNLGGVCSGYESHWINVTNTGNTIDSGQITYELDPLFGFIQSSPEPDNINGNILTWNYSNLYYGATMDFSVDVESPSVEYIGQSINQTLVTTVEDETGTILFSHTLNQSQIIACSLDPNELIENNGITSNGYLLPNGELEYTVFFENIGNADAIDVHIEDMLSSQLDLTTLHSISASHAHQITLSPNGLLVVSFPEINLSFTDLNPTESHGFFTFRITPIEGLPAGTVISNQATIYFDLNPGMATNVTLNTIYECADLHQGIVSETSVCSGEEISCGNNAIWIENLTWSFNGNEVGTGNYTHAVNESGTLTMHASNALCEYSQDFQLTANTAMASFTLNGNMLTANDAASYQWYLNGNEIVDATQQNYEIAETGNYSVMVVDENGCDDVSDAMSVAFVGMENSSITGFSVYPNPTKGHIFVNIPVEFIDAQLTIKNAWGQTVLRPLQNRKLLIS